MPELSYGVRVCAAVRAPNDQILVVRDITRAVEVLKFPGGRPKFGESLDAALRREVAEETGYAVVPTEIAYVAEQRTDRWGDVCLEVCFYAEIFGATNELVWSAGESVVGCLWLPVADPRLRAIVPDARLLLQSQKGQYVHAR